MRVSSARDRARGEGGGRHETHLGHGKLHAVCPLLLNHLNLTLSALDHGRKPERGWKETGGGCRRGQARSRPDRVASIVAARSGLAVSRARGGSSEGDRARARIVGRGRARGLHALGQVGEHELPPELVHRLGVLHDVLRVLGHGGVVVLHRGGEDAGLRHLHRLGGHARRALHVLRHRSRRGGAARGGGAREPSLARASRRVSPEGRRDAIEGGSGSPGCRFVDSPSLKNLTLRVERESRRRDGDLARLASRGRRTQRRASHTHPPPHTHTPRSRWLRCSSPPRSSRPPSPATSRCVPQPRERLENRRIGALLMLSTRKANPGRGGSCSDSPTPRLRRDRAIPSERPRGRTAPPPGDEIASHPRDRAPIPPRAYFETGHLFPSSGHAPGVFFILIPRARALALPPPFLRSWWTSRPRGAAPAR